MHICTKCATIFMPSLECLKIPYGRITKDGQRFLLELTIEDGISLRKAKKRLKNTFGFEISVDRLWYLIQSTGKKCNEKTNEIVVNFSGIVCYDEDIIRKTGRLQKKSFIAFFKIGLEKIKQSMNFYLRLSPIFII